MKFKATISGNTIINPNERAKFQMTHGNWKSYGIKMTNNFIPKGNNVFQEWFTLNDKAIFNLQHEYNHSNPLYRNNNVKKVSILSVKLAWDCL